MDSPLTISLALIALGLVLLLADLFLGTGVLAGAGLIVIVLGVAVPFYYGDTSTGIATLIGVGVGVPLVVGVVFNYWRKTRAGRRLFMAGPEEDATVATMPVLVELEHLRGRFGKAVSPLRPSGIVEFDGRRVDCLTEGIMVEAGTWVRCIEVKAGKVIVRPTDQPRLADLENADFT